MRSKEKSSKLIEKFENFKADLESIKGLNQAQDTKIVLIEQQLSVEVD